MKAHCRPTSTIVTIIYPHHSFTGRSSSVKVGALTGVAARLVGGRTIYSLLKLPVQKDGRITTLPLLTGYWLQLLRLEWKDIEFVFIDEISMVPYEILVIINSGLQQLKNNEEHFGGMHIILLLPPVRGHAVLHQPNNFEPVTHLWRLFSLCELTENMRQQGDNTFINILNALREDKLKGEHMKVLLEYRSEATVDVEVIHIYPTEAQVEDHGSKKVPKLQSWTTCDFSDKKSPLSKPCSFLDHL